MLRSASASLVIPPTIEGTDSHIIVKRVNAKDIESNLMYVNARAKTNTALHRQPWNSCKPVNYSCLPKVFIPKSIKFTQSAGKKKEEIILVVRRGAALTHFRFTPLIKAVNDLLKVFQIEPVRGFWTLMQKTNVDCTCALAK